MKNLVDTYEESKRDLRKKLASVANDPREVVKILQAKIIEFLHIDGEYVGNLNPSQTRIATALLMLMSMSISLNTLLTVEQVHFPDLEKSPRSESNTQLSNVARIAAPLSGGFLTAVGTTVLLGSYQFVFPIVLIGMVGTALGGFVAEKFLVTSEKEQIETDSNAHEYLKKVDIDKLLIEFEKQLRNIDRDVASIYDSQKPQKEVSKPHLTDLSDILEFFQKFIGDANSEKDKLPEFTKCRFSELESLLRQYGIETKFYSNDIRFSSGLDIEEVFDFEKSVISKIEEPVTLYPAFLKDGKVLISGRVMQP
jgi:hypothetical protein